MLGYGAGTFIESAWPAGPDRSDQQVGHPAGQVDRYAGRYVEQQVVTALQVDLQDAGRRAAGRDPDYGLELSIASHLWRMASQLTFRQQAAR